MASHTHALRKVKRTPITATLGRGKHWSEPEVSLMLDQVNKILPRGQIEWERVTVAYAAEKPPHWHERDEESIKSKFKTLKNHAKPTSDPQCPPNVKRFVQGRLRIFNDHSNS